MAEDEQQQTTSQTISTSHDEGGHVQGATENVDQSPLSGFIGVVRPFTGTDPTHTPTQFFQDLEEVAELAGWRARKTLIVAKARLRGKAQSFLNDTEELRLLKDYDEFKREFIARFEQTEPDSVRLHNLTSARQQPNEDVKQFAARIRSLAFRYFNNLSSNEPSETVENIKDKTKLGQFLSGLNGRVKRFVLSRSPATFSEAIRIAIEEETNNALAGHRSTVNFLEYANEPMDREISREVTGLINKQSQVERQVEKMCDTLAQVVSTLKNSSEYSKSKQETEFELRQGGGAKPKDKQNEYNPSNEPYTRWDSRNRERYNRQRDIRCFICAQQGHVSKECKYRKETQTTNKNVYKQDSRNKTTCKQKVNRSSSRQKDFDEDDDDYHNFRRGQGNKSRFRTINLIRSARKRGQLRNLQKYRTNVRYISVQHDTDLPVINGTCNTVRLRILVDTGASVSLIDEPTYRKISSRLRLEPFSTNVLIRSITGEELPLLGCYRLKFQVNGEEFIHPVHVVQGTISKEYNTLFGIDLLRKHQLDYSVSDGRLTRSPAHTQVATQRKCTTADTHGKVVATTTMQRYYAKVAEKIKIAPRTEVLVPVRVPENFSEYHVVLVEPIQNKQYKSFRIARSVNIVNAQNIVYTRVANVTEDLVHLNKGTKITEVDFVFIKKCQAVHKADPKRKHVRRKLVLESEQCGQLTTTQKRQLEDLLQKYGEVFATDPTDLVGTDILEHEIVLTDDKPIRQRAYKTPHALRGELETQINELLEAGIIRKSQSPYAFPVILVKKKDNTYRFCIDYRKLNEVTRKDSYPLPLIHQTLDLLAGSKYFSTLDLTAGFHQLPIKEEDKHKTAFICHHGLYEFNRLPFGLVNSPATFERAMDSVFSDLRDDAIFVYVDDILVASNDFQTHMQKLETVFKRLQAHSLKVKPTKCTFLKKEITYLGHVLDEQGIRPDPRNVDALLKYPVPKTVKQVRALLGLSGYYRRHIPNYSQITLPLTALTKKNVKFVWTDRCQKAFEEIIDMLTSEPVLVFPDFKKRFFLSTDASQFAIASVLEQETADGLRKPVAYYSRKLNSAEVNYSTTEKEALCIVASVTHFRPYLLGREFTVLTDHAPLRWLLKLKTENSRLIRWKLRLSEFIFSIEYRPGKQHINADVLSRQVAATESTIPQFFDDEQEKEEFRTEQINDPTLELIFKALDDPRDPKHEETVDRYYIRDEILWRVDSAPRNRPKGTVVQQMVVPSSFKKRVLDSVHGNPSSGHFAVDKTYEKLKRMYYWAGMFADTQNYVQSCKSCLERRGFKPNQKAELVKPTIPTGPWEKLAMDILGPLPQTENGNRYLLVVTDYFTKYPEVIPIPDQKADTVAQVFVEQVIARHGVPMQVLTDRGTNFLSTLMRNIYEKLRIHKLNTTAFHPSADGQVEKLNSTVLQLLSHCVSDNQRDWDKCLPFVLMAYRSAVHSSTKETPNFLMYGRDLHLPHDLMRQKPTFTYADTTSYAEDFVTRMQDAYGLVKENLEDNAEQQVKQRQRKARGKGIKVGSLVYLYTPKVKKGTTKKLAKLSRGPYRVIEQTSPVNYVIESVKNRKDRQRVHVDRLTLVVDRRPFVEFRELTQSQTPETEGAGTSTSESQLVTQQWEEEDEQTLREERSIEEETDENDDFDDVEAYPGKGTIYVQRSPMSKRPTPTVTHAPVQPQTECYEETVESGLQQQAHEVQNSEIPLATSSSQESNPTHKYDLRPRDILGRVVKPNIPESVGSIRKTYQPSSSFRQDDSEDTDTSSDFWFDGPKAFMPPRTRNKSKKVHFEDHAEAWPVDHRC